MDIDKISVRPGSVGTSDDDVTPDTADSASRDFDGDTVLEEAIGQAGPPGMGAFSPAPTHRHVRKQVPNLRLKIAISLSIAVIALVLAATW